MICIHTEILLINAFSNYLHRNGEDPSESTPEFKMFYAAAHLNVDVVAATYTHHRKYTYM